MYRLNNRVQLIGNLGNDPEVKKAANGKNWVRFSLATNVKYKDKSGQLQEKTQWHSCKAWNSVAEIAAKHLRKGRQVMISGSLEYEKYTDKEGIERVFTCIHLSDLLLLRESKPATADAKA